MKPRSPFPLLPAWLALLPAGLALFAPATARAGDTFRVEALEGERLVIIYSADGGTRPARKGDELKPWDVVQTDRRSAAQIRYPDGTLVQVGRDTKFTLQPSVQGTQENQLEWGQVRAQVAKQEDDLPRPRYAPPRFMIRTKTATMGVRGTDFVAGYDAGSGLTSLHTLEGTVAMGGDDASVMEWRAPTVSAGKEATIGTGSAAPVLTEFKPEVYRQQIRAEQPELAALPDRAAEPAPGSSKEDSAPQSVTAVQPPAPEEKLEAPLQLLRFRVGAVSLFETVGSTAGIDYTTVSPAWTPSLRIWRPISIFANISGFLLRNSATSTTFPSLHSGLDVSLRVIGPFKVEAGAGITALFSDVGTITAPGFDADVVWEFAPGKWIDSIYGGLAGFQGGGSATSSGAGAGVASLGVGLRF